MTSLSTTTQACTTQATTQASTYATTRAHSGKNRLASAIQQQEATGALSSTDATALTGALSAIDASLSGDSSSTTSGSTKLDPASMKDRIDSLISDQVSSGTLTSDQASELTNLFASHGKSVSSADSGSASDSPDGPPPNSRSGVGPGGSASDSVSSTGSASGSASSDLLSTFIQQLQAAQSSGSGYAASGLTSTARSSALLFDFNS